MIYRVIDKRGSGKTRRLMLIAKENNAIYVCGDPHAMEQKAHDYGIIGLTFMSYTEFFSKRREDVNFKYVIDELEIFLKRLAPYSDLLGYAVSEDD